MTTEIELKFIVTDQAIAELAPFLSQQSCTYQGQQHLLNTYYETDDYFLRRHHLGLRIRHFDEQYEMTVKTGGKVMAGLHQRPEYNVALTQPELSLALLPANIWPEHTDLVDLQQRLSPLFTTHFSRDKWLINYQSSTIELALDQGEIKFGQHVDKINEIELELKLGSLSDVLAFAQQFCQLGGLRLSNQSKAARGYALSQAQEIKAIKLFPILHTVAKSTVEQVLPQTIELALSHWQYHEELWLAGNPKAKDPIYFAMLTIRQIWVLWGNVIPRKATTQLRQQLDELEQLMLSDSNDTAICYQPRYAHTKLALTQWIIDKQWLNYVGGSQQTKLTSSFKRFADVMLSRTSKTLKEAFSQATTNQAFKDQVVSLRRQIINFSLLAGAYPDDIVHDYIEYWQNLLYAIEHNQSVEQERLAKLALIQPIFWLNSSQG